MTVARRNRWVLPLLGAVALGVLILRMRPEPSGPEEGAEPPRALPSELRYATNHAGLYDVAWQTTSTAQSPSTGPATTAVDFEGRVEVFDAGIDGERRLVGLRVVSSKRASATAFGKELFADDAAQRAQLKGKEVLLAVGAHGAVEHVYVPRDATPLAKNLLQPLALHFAVTMPGGDGGVTLATEQGDFGPVVWAISAGEGATLRRTSRESGTVGEGTIVFEGGVPARITTTVTATNPRAEQGMATMATSTFSATRVDGGGPAAQRTDLGPLNRHAPDERPTDVDERAANLALANGMKPEDVAAMVAAHGSGTPPQKGDVIRAAALLLAMPEIGDDLAKLFAGGAIGDHGRELVIDLLASAGDAKAQAVMRDLLRSPAAQRNRELYERLVQRFALVTAPVAESIAFVREEWHRARRKGERRVRQATVYTLGSMAGHAHAMRNDDLAMPVLGELLAALGSTKDDDEERGLVAALGNSGMQDGLGPILARAGSTDVRTRTQVATSLRKFDAPPVRAQLINLLGDEDPQVALAAARSLDVQRLGRPELEHLCERVEAQRVHPDVDATLVGVVATHVLDAALARRTLVALRARAAERPELLRQIDQALGTLSGDAQATP